MKVPLKWRIALTPVAVLALVYFVIVGIGMGVAAWTAGLIEFWRGE